MSDRDISSLDEDTQSYIKVLREEAKNNRLKAQDLLSKIEERDALVSQANTKLDELSTKVSQSSSLQQEYERALTQVSEAKLESTRLRVAVEAGLPVNFADRLRGHDADALKADAEALKSFLPKQAGSRHVAFDRTDVSEHVRTGKDALSAVILAQLESE